MLKAWEWMKAHWKWVLFPLGILLSILTVLGWVMGARRDDPISGTTDEEAKKTADDIFKASTEREEALVLLERQHAQKIATMSEEQRAEYKAVKAKPIEEVASWIDKL